MNALKCNWNTAMHCMTGDVTLLPNVMLRNVMHWNVIENIAMHCMTEDVHLVVAPPLQTTWEHYWNCFANCFWQILWISEFNCFYLTSLYDWIWLFWRPGSSQKYNVGTGVKKNVNLSDIFIGHFPNKHRHRRNVTSHHSFSLLWLFSLLLGPERFFKSKKVF